MLTIATQHLGSPAAVIAWLRDALAAGPAHINERSPAERLRPALEAATPADRDVILVGLVEALETAEDSLREHILYSLQGFDTEPLCDALVDLLEPAPAPWLGHGSLASTFFHVLTHGPGLRDERLILGLRRLARQHNLERHALPHFVTFHTRDHGFHYLSDHLDDGGELDADMARRFGRRFGRNAPEHLQPLARKLMDYPEPVRAAFAEGAATKIPTHDAEALRLLLELPTGVAPHT